VRPSASVPAKATAIQRMPAAAPSNATPCFTNANEKISTHDTAKNSVVVRISPLFTSMAKSFFSTSSATLRNIILCSRGPTPAR
jgi:hypothetical protein